MTDRDARVTAMGAPITMNKVIHGAIRRDLARLLDALAEFPDGNKARAANLHTAWKYFYGELDHHHHGEHDIAWPALLAVGVQQDLLDQMDAEHDKLADALVAADLAFSTLEREPSLPNATAARSAVTVLRDIAEAHLQHEEAEVEPVYYDKRDTAEIKAMGRKFSKRNVFKSGDFFAWLQNGATAEEMTALRDTVPGPVVAIFGTVFGRRYKRKVAPVWR